MDEMEVRKKATFPMELMPLLLKVWPTTFRLGLGSQLGTARIRKGAPTHCGGSQSSDPLHFQTARAQWY